MEVRKISEIDCSKMCIHPQSPQLVNFMENEIPQLKHIKVEYQKKVFTKGHVYRYILLMYDPQSPVLKMSSLDHWGHKWQSVSYAGFPQKRSRHDGQMRFDDRVLKMVLGEDNAINDMILLFVKWVNVKDWGYLVYLNEAMAVHILDAMRNKQDSKSIKEVMLLKKEIADLSRQMAKEEVERDEYISRFYYQIEQSRNAVRPEDFAKRLNDGDDLSGESVYGAGYTAKQLKFVGKESPKK